MLSSPSPPPSPLPPDKMSTRRKVRDNVAAWPVLRWRTAAPYLWYQRGIWTGLCNPHVMSNVLMSGYQISPHCGHNALLSDSEHTELPWKMKEITGQLVFPSCAVTVLTVFHYLGSGKWVLSLTTSKQEPNHGQAGTKAASGKLIED